jgi:hypothetical protein
VWNLRRKEKATISSPTPDVPGGCRRDARVLVGSTRPFLLGVQAREDSRFMSSLAEETHILRYILFTILTPTHNITIL